MKQSQDMNIEYQMIIDDYVTGTDNLRFKKSSGGGRDLVNKSYQPRCESFINTVLNIDTLLS